MFLHLIPEQFASRSRIGIIERTYIARTHPIAYAILHRLLIHPAIGIKLLVMLRIDIKLGPYRYHDMSTHIVHIIHHLFRIGESSRIELMTTPLVFTPIEPVLYNIVDRYLTLTKLLKGRNQFLLVVIFLTALPITHRPLRHNGRLTSQGAIATDDLIHRVTSHKIVIHRIGHLAVPINETDLVFSCWLSCLQSAIRNSSVRFPLDANRYTTFCFNFEVKLICIWIPSRTPSFRHHQLVVKVYLHIAGIV